MSQQNKRKNIVKKMREIRENLSSEIMNMTLEEQRSYVKKQLKDLKQSKKSVDKII